MEFLAVLCTPINFALNAHVQLNCSGRHVTSLKRMMVIGGQRRVINPSEYDFSSADLATFRLLVLGTMHVIATGIQASPISAGFEDSLRLVCHDMTKNKNFIVGATRSSAIAL